MAKGYRRMINLLQIQLAEQRHRYAQERERASIAEGKYNSEAAAWKNQFAEIQQSNLDSAAQAQANFEKQLQQSQTAADQTIAGLEQLLLDQQNTAKIQAQQFAEQSALAEAALPGSDATDESRIQNAYVPRRTNQLLKHHWLVTAANHYNLQLIGVKA